MLRALVSRSSRSAASAAATFTHEPCSHDPSSFSQSIFINGPPIPLPATTQLLYFASGSKKSMNKIKTREKMAEKKKSQAKSAEGPSTSSDVPEDSLIDRRERAFDVEDVSKEIGPKGLPLFTQARSISQLTGQDACSYINFSMEELSEVLPEGLPSGMKKEFEDTRRSALLVRQSFLELRDNFRRIVDPPPFRDSKSPKAKKQIVLDGPVSCGKSITLAMLVHWARSEGWLVFYVPSAREWTHGGFFYKSPHTDLWDTPVQAAKILQDFVKFNEGMLQRLPCQVLDPIPLGEGAGVGFMKGVDSMAMSEGSTLYDLIKTGLTYTHAAVGVVLRLRKELSLVKDIPVLIAIDQYNSWFTFSEFGEPMTDRSWRQIHAKELATVNAFRSMKHHNDMMVGAFSHSTAVGKIRKDLPDVPAEARIFLPRYTLDEAASVFSYYRRQRLIHEGAFSEEGWKKIYYLANGNGSEIRFLLPFMHEGIANPS